MDAGGSKIGFCSLLSTFTNKFFDPSTPSMRKGHNREKKMEEKIMMFIVATNVIAKFRLFP